MEAIDLPTAAPPLYSAGLTFFGHENEALYVIEMANGKIVRNFYFLTRSTLEKLPHHFGGRCDNRRSKVETFQFDGESGEIHPSQMLVTRQKQARSEQCRFGHQLRVVHL